MMTRSRLLVIVGVAAVIVMALAAVLITGGGQQDNISNSEQPQQSPNRTDIKVYYISLNNVIGTISVVGCNDGLIEQTVPIEGKTASLEAIYKQELALPKDTQKPGFYNALARSTLDFQTARIEDGTANINLTGTLVTGDSCDKARVRAQLEYPALQIDGVDSVVVRVNGYLLEELF